MGIRGVILAGGENSRMHGFPKGKIRLDGDRLFDRILETLRSITLDIVVSVHDEIPIDLPGSVSIIKDHNRNNRSSMNGVYSVLRELQEPALIVPWDMPFVITEQLKQLIDKSRDNGAGTFYRVNDVIQPFPGLYRLPLIDRLQEALDCRNYSIREVLKDSPISVLNLSTHVTREYAEPKNFKNINSPEDLKKLNHLPTG